MKYLKRSILSVMLILILLASSFVPSFASDSGVLQYSSDTNSGTRDVVCTTLEGTSAASYYQGYNYDDLSAMNSTALFNSLQTLMRNTHTYTSSYNDCHYEANRTDCENNDSAYLSLIYTSYSATMDQWNGWNREHIWPQSLGGDNTNGGGADLHHIRPSDAGVNSSRGNKKYGESGSGASEKYGTDPAVGVLGGTYNSTYFEPLDNVKGDVARICLYVYVRWNSDWGAGDITKVFQSVDILLEWCELDPVDTWEMGRNEVVEDIQGNRNVFIDYPEYAWLLFGREVPTDMVTPSGEASDGELSGGGSNEGGSSAGSGDVVVDPDEGGDTGDTGSGTETVNGDRYYIATKRTSGNYFYMTNDLGTASTSRYQAIDSGLTSLPAEITDQNDGYTFTVVDNGDNTYSILSESLSGDNYLGWTSGNSGKFVSKENAIKFTRTDNSDGTVSFHFAASDAERYLALNANTGNNYFALYKSGQKQNLVLIPVATDSDCPHENQTTTTIEATCTVAGSTNVICDDCKAILSTTSIPATGHRNTTETVKAATCTVAGSITVKCDDCQQTVSTTSISATGHRNTTETVKAATCTDTGLRTVTCDDCGETVSSSVIATTDHSYVGGVCEDCGALESSYICTFVGPEGSYNSSVSGSSITMPGAPTLTNDYKKNYSFIGWVASVLEDTVAAPDLYGEGESVSINENTTFYALYTYTEDGEGVAGFVEKDISEISSTDVVVITVTTSGGTVYALPNDGGAATPKAIIISVSGTAISGTVAENLKWNISNSSGNLTIYPNGTTANRLYCNNSNSGVRIGTAANEIFTIDSTSGYLKNTGTGRYVGVYTTNPDWRCYTNTSGNIANQTLKFYVEASSETVYYTTELLFDCSHTNTTEDIVSPTCTASGFRTVICDLCGETVSSEVIDALGHSFMDEICMRCGYTEEIPSGSLESGWYLVTDISELKAGDRIVIVSGTFVAGNISNSIMASVNGITANDGVITTLPSGAQILTLGGSTGAWTLTNSDGKLLGATNVKKLAWGSGTTTWGITISGSSATIQSATSSYGRILYNVNSPRFTTYTSGASTTMLLPEIYKYVEGSGDSEGVKFSTASLTIGSTLAINYYVTGHDTDTEYYVVFTMDGIQSDKIYGTENNGRLKFTFTDIPPQFMGDNVSAYLYTTDAEAPVATMETFSVKIYAEKAIELFGSDEELMDLIADMLRYGAAAQLYRGHNTDALVTSGFDLDSFGSNAVPTEEDNNRTLDPSSNVSDLTDSFTAVGVRFDFDNKIYFKFKTDDLAKIKITVNGVDIDNLSEKVTYIDGKYSFYTDGISATRFDEVFTFELYVNGTLHQTMTYSVNSYAYAKCGDTTVDDESTLSPLAQLVRALYKYGLSAKAYNQ